MSRGDLDNIKCIKIGPKYISRKNDIKERWMSYFHKLFDESNLDYRKRCKTKNIREIVD